MPITPATMASLKIHLTLIEAYVAPPRRGTPLLGSTVVELAERHGTYRQLIRSRLARGVAPEEAVLATHRGVGRHAARTVRVGAQELSLRAFARSLGTHPYTVSRMLARGLTPEQVAERCA